MSNPKAGALAIVVLLLLSALARAIAWRGAAGYVQVEPWLGIAAVGLAAFARTGPVRRPTLVQRRRCLLAWLLLAAVLLAAPFALGPAFPRALLFAVGAVAGVVAVAEAVGLQGRLRAMGSPVTPWQVAGTSAFLVMLGPAALLPPFGVWVHSGRFVEESPKKTRR